MQNEPQNKQKNIEELEMLASIPVVASNSIILLDSAGDIIWANDGFEKLHGYSYNSEKAKVYSLDFIKKVKETDSIFFIKNTSLSFSYSFVGENNKRKWVQTTLTPVIENCEVKQFVAIGVDITQQKEVEDELIQRQENTQTLSEHLESIKDHIEVQIEELNKQKNILEAAKEKSEDVLNRVIPYEVAVQLKKKGYATPRHYKKVSVLNVNIRNFNQLAEAISIDDLISHLHNFFVKFDNILEEHYVEKIKTIGGYYIGVGGVPLRNRSNPIDTLLAALRIRETVSDLNSQIKKTGIPPFEVGIGINTGKAIAGVVGKTRLSYDVWGDTVNDTALIEKSAPVGGILISNDTYNEVSDYFICSFVEINNEQKYWLVESIKPQYSNNEQGIVAGHELMQILSKL